MLQHECHTSLNNDYRFTINTESQQDLDNISLAASLAESIITNQPYDRRALECYESLPFAKQLIVDNQVKLICSCYPKVQRTAFRRIAIFLSYLVFAALILLGLLFASCTTASSATQDTTIYWDEPALVIYWDLEECFEPEQDILIKEQLTRTPNIAETIPSLTRVGFTMDDDIRLVLKSISVIMQDFDHNGKINCVDKAIAFKLTWDELFDNVMYPCEIVRNYNPGKLNHLFVRVKMVSFTWIYIEPSCSYWTPSYDMKNVWRSNYNPACNYYGETHYWLNKCR